MPNEFRDELRRLAAAVQEPLKTSTIQNPDSYGWLRRPERDQPGLAAWERPDGEVFGIEADIPAAGRRRSGHA